MRKTTTIVPIGNFTPALARRVRETALASAQRQDVIISLHSTERCSWSALYELAESLRSATPYSIRLSRALPRTRALLGEFGIQNGWFVDDASARSEARILIREGDADLSSMARERYGEPESFSKINAS